MEKHFNCFAVNGGVAYYIGAYQVSHTLMIDVDLNEDLPEKKKKVEGARHSFMSNFSYLHHS